MSPDVIDSITATLRDLVEKRRALEGKIDQSESASEAATKKLAEATEQHTSAQSELQRTQKAYDELLNHLKSQPNYGPNALWERLTVLDEDIRSREIAVRERLGAKYQAEQALAVADGRIREAESELSRVLKIVLRLQGR
jgi:chromosome segregation ATPase